MTGMHNSAASGKRVKKTEEIIVEIIKLESSRLIPRSLFNPEAGKGEGA
jgi:hypothetical protein